MYRAHIVPYFRSNRTAPTMIMVMPSHLIEEEKQKNSNEFWRIKHTFFKRFYNAKLCVSVWLTDIPRYIPLSLTRSGWECMKKRKNIQTFMTHNESNGNERVYISSHRTRNCFFSFDLCNIELKFCEIDDRSFLAFFSFVLNWFSLIRVCVIKHVFFCFCCRRSVHKWFGLLYRRKLKRANCKISRTQTEKPLNSWQSFLLSFAFYQCSSQTLPIFFVVGLYKCACRTFSYTSTHLRTKNSHTK